MLHNTTLYNNKKPRHRRHLGGLAGAGQLLTSKLSQTRKHISTTKVYPESVRQRIIATEKHYADSDFGSINFLARVKGLAWKDATRQEALEREVNRLKDHAGAVGLSEEQRHELARAEEELDRFRSAAACHAKKQSAKKQRQAA